MGRSSQTRRMFTGHRLLDSKGANIVRAVELTRCKPASCRAHTVSSGCLASSSSFIVSMNLGSDTAAIPDSLHLNRGKIFVAQSPMGLDFVPQLLLPSAVNTAFADLATYCCRSVQILYNPSQAYGPRFREISRNSGPIAAKDSFAETVRVAFNVALLPMRAATVRPR
jgi:hypothetical protein